MNQPLGKLVVRSGVTYGERVSHRDTQPSFFNWQALSNTDMNTQKSQAGEKPLAWELRFWRRAFWVASTIMVMLLIAGFSVSEHESTITAIIIPLFFFALFATYKLLELENRSTLAQQLAATTAASHRAQSVQYMPQDSVQLTPLYKKCNLLQNVVYSVKQRRADSLLARYQFCGYEATESPLLQAIEDAYMVMVADVAHVGRPRNLWLGIVDYPEAVEAVAAFYRHFAVCEQEADATQIAIAMHDLPIDAWQTLDTICEEVVDRIVAAWCRAEAWAELDEITQSHRYCAHKEDMKLAVAQEAVAINAVTYKLLAAIRTYLASR